MQTPPRCNDHTGRETFPAACHICQRIQIEQDIVTRVVDALLAAGFEMFVHQYDDAPDSASLDRTKILSDLGEADDEFLVVRRPTTTTDQPRNGWVRFVYGNDGYDVISDYTVSLESILAPVNAFTDTLS